MSIERNIQVIVSTQEFNRDQKDDYNCNCNASLNVEVLSLEELLIQPWMVDKLREIGFYSKDEIGVNLKYLNRFVYEYSSGYNKSYKEYTNNISHISHYNDNIIGVYQEVVGAERINAFSKWKKLYDEYHKKQKEKKALLDTKKKQAAENRRLKAIEKAKEFLAQQEEIK